MPESTSGGAPAFHWGPANPHPLSKMHTELVWEGKYDEFGRRREVDVAALAMPMQRIETVDEPRQRAAAMGQTDMFEQKLLTLQESAPAYKTTADFRNRLIWGDNKLVMASLLAEFKGKIDLIYIDPPFDVGADFTMDVPIGDEKETILKDQSCLEMVAFKDMWGKGTDSYLHMMFERLSLMKEMLSDTGSIYLHCDWRVNYLLRSVMNEVFGSDNCLNHIIWSYKRWPSQSKIWQGMHDDILWFAKNTEAKNRVFNVEYELPSESYVKRFGGKTQVLDEVTRTRKITVDIPTKGLSCRDVWDISTLLSGY